LPFKIKYRFKDNSKYYNCIMTYAQYQNFKNLPVIAECKITNKNEVSKQEQLDEMQEALNMAFKDDVSHIKKLSHPEKYV